MMSKTHAPFFVFPKINAKEFAVRSKKVAPNLLVSAIKVAPNLLIPRPNLEYFIL